MLSLLLLMDYTEHIITGPLATAFYRKGCIFMSSEVEVLVKVDSKLRYGSFLKG